MKMLDLSKTKYIKQKKIQSAISFLWYMYIAKNKQVSEYIILHEENNRCLQQQESLLLQLQLMQEYKLKIEMEFKNIKEQTTRELNKVMTQLKKASDERDNYKSKYLLCNKNDKLNKLTNKSAMYDDTIIKTRKLQDKINYYEQVKNENNKQLDKINGTLLQTQKQLDKCITDLNLSLQQYNILKVTFFIVLYFLYFLFKPINTTCFFVPIVVLYNSVGIEIC
uniref:Transmembrane protein n=1 Tax=Strongyloides stercoralis TaxID=6248 RepID=A0A0K0E1Y2_STRER